MCKLTGTLIARRSPAGTRAIIVGNVVALLLCGFPAAAQVTPSPKDTIAGTTAPGRRPAPVPEGQTIRIVAPTLPTADRRLTGVFLGVDTSADGQTLRLRTTRGTRFVPCTLVQIVQTPTVRHIPLWEKAGWTLVGAWGGLALAHAVADAPGGIDAEDPPLPHPDRDNAAHRRANRILISGSLIGAGLAYFVVRDSDRWHLASLGGCTDR